MTGPVVASSRAPLARVLRGSWAPLLVWAVASLTLVAGSMLGVARVVVHHCVTVDGTLGLVGLRLQLLGDVADCPDGTLALLPSPGQNAVVMLSLALPVLAAHAALGACGLGLAALVARARSVVAQVLGRALRPADEARAIQPVEARPAAPAGLLLPPFSSGAGERHPLRGPPVALA